MGYYHMYDSYFDTDSIAFKFSDALKLYNNNENTLRGVHCLKSAISDPTLLRWLNTIENMCFENQKKLLVVKIVSDSLK